MSRFMVKGHSIRRAVYFAVSPIIFAAVFATAAAAGESRSPAGAGACSKQLAQANAALRNASDIDPKVRKAFRKQRDLAKVLCAGDQVLLGRTMLEEMTFVLRSYEERNRGPAVRR